MGDQPLKFYTFEITLNPYKDWFKGRMSEWRRLGYTSAEDWMHHRLVKKLGTYPESGLDYYKWLRTIWTKNGFDTTWIDLEIKKEEEILIKNKLIKRKSNAELSNSD